MIVCFDDFLLIVVKVRTHNLNDITSMCTILQQTATWLNKHDLY